MRVTWLPQVLRDAGLAVAVQPGADGRGRDFASTPKGVIAHHTAGPSRGEAPSLGIVTNGRSDLPGPLSQLVLGRSGTFYYVAAGRANHAGAGNWQGVTTGNASFIGIEAEATGRDAWPDVQMDAYRRGVAAILRRLGRDASWVCGHKEYALPRGRKPDPNFDMGAFRSSVQRLLAGAPQPPAPKAEDNVPALIQGKSGNLEAAFPHPTAGVIHRYRDDKADGKPWAPGAEFGQQLGKVTGVSLIESSYGNLEALVLAGGHATHWWRSIEADGRNVWHGPTAI